ncbi:MAG: hypothetical protein HXY34_04160 [Candidatus Thorarchaeota archaeon]|nr:hypothetical protein [Candidatus Thorarchaeota archaeon]
MAADDLLSRHRSGGDRLGDIASACDVFDRQFGAELAEWEMRLQAGFRETLPGRRYRHVGFVHHTRDTSLVLLTPSPWLLSGVFVQFASDQTVPPDGVLAEVVGRRIAVRRIGSSGGELTEAFSAEEFQELRFDLIRDARPPLSLKELQEMLFENVGMAEASKNVFTRLFVSSPPYEGSIGGLTTGIQALVSAEKVRRLMTFIRRLLPPSLHGRWPAHRDFRGFRVSTPRIWRMDVGAFDRPRMERLCVQRQDSSGFREVSLSAMTTAQTSALPDVPIALASEDFWIEAANPTLLRLPVLKAAITYQLLTPSITVKVMDEGTKHVLTRLEHLKDSLGLEDSVLSRGSALDADLLGRPLSALRLARSGARAFWKEKVGLREFKSAWDRALEPALKEFLELTQLRAKEEGEWRESRPYEKLDTRVLRALKKLDPASPSDLGPTLAEIASEAGVERHVAAEALAKMKDAGVVYEPRSGRFRLL